MSGCIIYPCSVCCTLVPEIRVHPDMLRHGRNYSVYGVTLTLCTSMAKCMGGIECLDLAPLLEVPGN